MTSLAMFPLPSDHGDVHALKICRTDGKSLTVDDYRRVFTAVTGRELTESEVDVVRDWFAEEDR